MTKLELGTIISKVFALYYFFKLFSILTFSVLPLILHVEDISMNSDLWVLTITSLIAPLVLSMLFWFGAEKVGKKIAGKNDQKDIGMLKHEDLMACIFVGFGCFLLYSVISAIAEPLSVFFSNDEIRRRYTSSQEMTQDMIQSSLYLFLSMCFIFGANGLQKTVFWLHGLGNKLK